MASVTVHATLMLNTGELVDLNTTMTEGTETELQVGTDFAVAATSLGQFADGKTITQIIMPPTAPNGIAYAYLDRRGSILACLPLASSCSSGASWSFSATAANGFETSCDQ